MTNLYAVIASAIARSNLFVWIATTCLKASLAMTGRFLDCHDSAKAESRNDESVWIALRESTIRPRNDESVWIATTCLKASLAMTKRFGLLRRFNVNCLAMTAIFVFINNLALLVA